MTLLVVVRILLSNEIIEEKNKQKKQNKTKNNNNNKNKNKTIAIGRTHVCDEVGLKSQWTHCILETHKRVTGKQCRPRSDDAERRMV